MLEETIVAIATPPGRGGVGIIRMSGPKAHDIAMQLNGNKPLTPRLAAYTHFYIQAKELVDQGIMIYFKAPHSFTGEDIVELQTHGSPMVMDVLIKECIHLGARLARPGEFSERAFLNDKIDLAQAEAIADLIQANSQTAARMALKTLQGDFSKKINELNEKIIHLRLYVEAAIDFPEEEIDFLNDGTVSTQLQSILDNLESIRSQTNQGVILREGLSLVIAGLPNAGKSTLINQLSGKDVAIVTDIAGTTRDVMRQHILIDDIPIHIIDTAGLRQSDCPVEQEGIKRAWSELKQADAVLFVMDVHAIGESMELMGSLKEAIPDEIPIIKIINKIDSVKELPKLDSQAIPLCAKSGEGLVALKEQIKKIAGYQPTEGHFLARRRHLRALDEALALLLTGREQLSLHRAGELLAEDLRQAHQCLSEITGEFTPDDLLGKIFSSFCIGK